MIFAEAVQSTISRIGFGNFFATGNAKSLISSAAVQSTHPFSAGLFVTADLNAPSTDDIDPHAAFWIFLHL
ncbi:MAG TPA: hypothetical protein PKX74_07555, partial [Leptospiraceae bacterium]|nr:hypothetical protein [Leptospiraceae bacterium]